MSTLYPLRNYPNPVARNHWIMGMIWVRTPCAGSLSREGRRPAARRSTCSAARLSHMHATRVGLDEPEKVNFHAARARCVGLAIAEHEELNLHPSRAVEHAVRRPRRAQELNLAVQPTALHALHANPHVVLGDVWFTYLVITDNV
jgi:hypothetical protein